MGPVEVTIQASQAPGARPGSGPAGAISLHGVHKHFGAVQAVRGLDLSIGHGEVVAFLGPNGAGKTTTIDMILGLSQPTAGDVSVFGLAPRQAISRGLVSAVLQTGGLLPDMTVAETARVHRQPVPRPPAGGRGAAPGRHHEIGDRLVGKCSGGEKQRLRFAMALLPDPELLILDEPTTGMDVEGRRSFWAAIREDTARGRTVLFATHYLEEADAYADRIVLISHGLKVADGTASEVKAMASGRTVRATLAGADAAALGRDPGRGHRRDPRRHGADPLQRQRRGGQVPAQRHPGPRPGDHHPRPGGRLPRPDRRRGG